MTIKDKKIITLTFFLFVSNLLFTQNSMEIIAELEGEHPGARFGFSTTSLDFNGDSIDDLVVTAERWDPEYPGWPATPISWGKIYIYFGKEIGFGDSVDLTISGFDPQLYLTGKYVENLGDMNGDGYDDLAYYNNLEQNNDELYYMIYVLLGGEEPDIVPDYIFSFDVNEWGSSNLTAKLRWLGDINGDEYDDAGLILGDSDDIYQNMIIYGGTFDLTFFNSFPRHNHVPFIYGAGDTNSDGFGDFIIGHKENDLIINELYYGSTIIDTIPDIVLTDHINFPYLNTCGGFYCGDWNGDGLDDFIGNCSSHFTEGLGIWYGSDPQILGPQMMAEFYDWIPQRNYDYGDLNNDGKDDIIAGLHDVSGRIYCFLGCQNGTYDLRIEGQNLSDIDNLGWSIAIGDYNGDGFEDIAAGAPALDSYTYSSGNVIVFAGNADLEEADPNIGLEDQVIKPSGVVFNAYPNPFNPRVTFEIKAEDYNSLQIEIFNIKGQMIESLSVLSSDSAEDDIIEWNAENYASGVYYCKLINIETKTQLALQKITLLK